jgi:hypothetical protein
VSDTAERLEIAERLRLRDDYLSLDEAAEEIESMCSRLAEIIAYCAQEGNDGEPYDTIHAIATGEYSTRGSGRNG